MKRTTLALPLVGFSLWFAAAVATLTQLESMARTTTQLQATPSPAAAPAVTAGR